MPVLVYFQILHGVLITIHLDFGNAYIQNCLILYWQVNGHIGPVLHKPASDHVKDHDRNYYSARSLYNLGILYTSMYTYMHPFKEESLDKETEMWHKV